MAKMINMKTRNKSGWTVTSFMITGLAAAWMGTSEAGGAEKKVTVTEGSPVVMEDGQRHPLKQNLDLTSAIQVRTNGTFTVNQGKPRKLLEGQILDQEGMLTNPNGTTKTVWDHLTKERGQMVLFRDGKGSALQQAITLPTGVEVRPNGVIALPDGQINRFLEGQIMKLDGTVLAATDTVMLKNGTVYVQKDGSQFPLRRRQSLMMNDGTKVFGTGKVAQKNGETIQLAEGQILKIKGITFGRSPQ